MSLRRLLKLKHELDRLELGIQQRGLKLQSRIHDKEREQEEPLTFKEGCHEIMRWIVTYLQDLMSLKLKNSKCPIWSNVELLKELRNSWVKKNAVIHNKNWAQFFSQKEGLMYIFKGIIFVLSTQLHGR